MNKQIAILGLLLLNSAFVLGGQTKIPENSRIVHIKPGPQDNFSKAVFYLRVPEKVTKPKYILVLLKGINADGSGLLEHKQWLQFASETQAAIVACTLVKKDKKKYDKHNHYAAAQCGSGAALESAIEKLDEAQKGYSLKELPLLIYGFSAGGQFAFGFSCHNPTRMIGFAAGKGGYYYPEAIKGTYKVPGLMISGKKDKPKRKNAIRELFELNRAQGAPWCWMEDKSSHVEANILSVVIPYFKELLRLQLDGDSKKLPDRSKLVGVSVDLEEGKILSDRKAFDADDTDPKQGWLPSRLVFDAWKREDIGVGKYAEQQKARDKTCKKRVRDSVHFPLLARFLSGSRRPLKIFFHCALAPRKSSYAANLFLTPFQKVFNFDETTMPEGPLHSATHPSSYFFRVKITEL